MVQTTHDICYMSMYKDQQRILTWMTRPASFDSTLCTLRFAQWSFTVCLETIQVSALGLVGISSPFGGMGHVQSNADAIGCNVLVISALPYQHLIIEFAQAAQQFSRKDSGGVWRIAVYGLMFCTYALANVHIHEFDYIMRFML